MTEATPDDRPETLRELQSAVDAWIRSVGVRYFSPLSNLAQLTEEVGELARAMNRAYGDQSPKAGESAGGIADELADVLFVLTCLANQCGVDLQQAVAANLRKKTRRDSGRHHSNPKLTVGWTPEGHSRDEPGGGHNQPVDESEGRTR